MWAAAFFAAASASVIGGVDHGAADQAGADRRPRAVLGGLRDVDQAAAVNSGFISVSASRGGAGADSVKRRVEKLEQEQARLEELDRAGLERLSEQQSQEQKQLSQQEQELQLGQQQRLAAEQQASMQELARLQSENREMLDLRETISQQERDERESKDELVELEEMEAIALRDLQTVIAQKAGSVEVKSEIAALQAQNADLHAKNEDLLRLTEESQDLLKQKMPAVAPGAMKEKEEALAKLQKENEELQKRNLEMQSQGATVDVSDLQQQNLKLQSQSGGGGDDAATQKKMADLQAENDDLKAQLEEHTMAELQFAKQMLVSA